MKKNIKNLVVQKFSVKYELESLTTPDLNKLKETLKQYMPYKNTILMVFVAIFVPFASLGLYNQYTINGYLIFKYIFYLTLFISIIRYFFDNKILENIFIIIFGLLYCLLLINVGYELSYLMIFFIVGVYYIGTKILMKKSFIAWRDKYVVRGETKRTRLGAPVIIAIGSLPLILGANVENILLILGSFFLSMGSISNAFNTYYSKEIESELKKR